MVPGAKNFNSADGQHACRCARLITAVRTLWNPVGTLRGAMHAGHQELHADAGQR